MQRYNLKANHNNLMQRYNLKANDASFDNQFFV